MLDLLIAILIALGCTVNSGSTAEEIKAQNPEAYEKAIKIQETGNYREVEGGVVIVEIVGD